MERMTVQGVPLDELLRGSLEEFGGDPTAALAEGGYETGDLEKFCKN